MDQTILMGILIPFIGTAAGAGCVFFMKRNLSRTVERALMGFASGVMVAASIWSLLIPAMEQCVEMGKMAFLPRGRRSSQQAEKDNDDGACGNAP